MSASRLFTSIRGAMDEHGGMLPNNSVLYLTVLGAHGLKNTQTLGVQDPYCAVHLVSQGKDATKPVFKTATHDNGGTEPVWNEKGTVLIPDVSSDVLRIKILNENWVGSNVIGEAAVAVRDLSRGRSIQKEFALSPKGFVRVLLYLALANENPTTQPRVEVGEYPQHFIPGRTKLFLALVAGEKLRDVQAIGEQDPYCLVYVGRSRKATSNEQVYKTKTHDNGGKNPQWMEAMTVGVRCIEHDFLTIRVMDENHFKDEFIGELSLKLELLIGHPLEDKLLPIEANGTIVGQLHVQLALFNDEVLDEEELSQAQQHGDLDGCTCSIQAVPRATKVGDVIISGISPEGMHYLDAGSVITTGCTLAGNYVVEKDYWEGDEF